MKELFNTIYAYGSENAIRILATMQKHNYANSLEEKDGEAKNMLLAYYILLAAQIGYDVTGEIINPLSWYEIRMEAKINVRNKRRIFLRECGVG